MHKFPSVQKTRERHGDIDIHVSKYLQTDVLVNKDVNLCERT